MNQQFNLSAALKALVGDENVLTDASDKKRYDVDHTGKYQGRSLAVVRPVNTGDVAAVLELAHQNRTPVVPMGGNTGLCGGCYPGEDETAIVLSLERMNDIREINAGARTLTVDAGAILQDVHDAVDAHGLVLPITFGAKGSCRIGGILSTNAGGSNVVRYGTTRSLCLGLEVVAPNGRVLNLMSSLRKDNTGYDLKNLFIGAEGTLGVITKAVFRLFPKPCTYATAIVSLTDLEAALAMLNALNDKSAGAVEAFEYIPGKYFELFYETFPDHPKPLGHPAQVNVMVELGLMDEAAAGEGPLMAVLERGFEDGWVLDAVIAQSETQRREMWQCREAALDALWTRGQLILTDLSLPLDQVPVFLRRMNARLAEVAPDAGSMEITHLGDGNVHFTVWREPREAEFAPDKVREITGEAERLTHELGGAFSAEHGVGITKLSAMRTHKDPAVLEVMCQIKQALDPLNIMNPGKVLPDLNDHPLAPE